MNMRTIVSLVAVCLSICACQKPTSEASSKSSSGGGGGLLHDLQSEMLGSSKATRQGVALDLYFDVSDSSTALKKPLSKLLERVVDTYPDAIPYSYSFYGKSCNLQDSGVANVQSIRRAAKAWTASSMRDKTTNLSQAFEKIRTRAEGDPDSEFAAVIVTDGGFEDPDAARGELRRLRRCENVRLLTFVGIHTGDNPKLQRLTELVNATNGEPGNLKVQIVTDANNESSAQDARDALRAVVDSARKVD